MLLLLSVLMILVVVGCCFWVAIASRLWKEKSRSPFTAKVTQQPNMEPMAFIGSAEEHHPEKQQPVCRVALKNNIDFHYEIIESTILRYPLPWEVLGCKFATTTSANKKPIVVFDVALSQPVGHRKEKQGWQDYFEHHLKGTVRDRSDGIVQAQFGEIIADYQSVDAMDSSYYSAVIGVSCDFDSDDFVPWLAASPSRFCVLHGTMPRWSEDRKSVV